MKTPKWKPETIHKEGNITITLHFLPEEIPYSSCFQSVNHDARVYSGMYYFCVKLQASIGRVEITQSDTYLGCNIYESKRAVMGDRKLESILSGYGSQLVEECLEKAKEALGGVL